MSETLFDGGESREITGYGVQGDVYEANMACWKLEVGTEDESIFRHTPVTSSHVTHPYSASLTTYFYSIVI